MSKIDDIVLASFRRNLKKEGIDVSNFYAVLRALDSVPEIQDTIHIEEIRRGETKLDESVVIVEATYQGRLTSSESPKGKVQELREALSTQPGLYVEPLIHEWQMGDGDYDHVTYTFTIPKTHASPFAYVRLTATEEQPIHSPETTAAPERREGLLKAFAREMFTVRARKIPPSSAEKTTTHYSMKDTLKDFFKEMFGYKNRN